MPTTHAPKHVAQPQRTPAFHREQQRPTQHQRTRGIPARAYLHGFIVAALLLCMSLVSAAVEIPCTPTYGVLSYTSYYTSYTLTNCTLPDGVDPFVVLTPAFQGAALVANVAIDVVGGRVLPFFVVPGPATQRVENISVSVRGSTVGPYVYRPNSTKQLCGAVFSSSGVAVVRNVTTAIEGSVVNVTMGPSIALSKCSMLCLVLSAMHIERCASTASSEGNVRSIAAASDNEHANAHTLLLLFSHDQRYSDNTVRYRNIEWRRAWVHQRCHKCDTVEKCLSSIRSKRYC